MSRRELAREMSTLEPDLAEARAELRAPAALEDERVVEGVAARTGLAQNAFEVGADGRERTAARLEARELRMVPIAARAAREHALREQRFAPERDEALRV